MFTLFHLRAYTADDPLDCLSPLSRHALAAAVTFVVNAAILYVVYNILNISTLIVP